MSGIQKENITFPTLVKSSSLEVRPEKYFVKPKLSRILYKHGQDPSKRMNKKFNIFEAFQTNKNYDDIIDELKEREIETYLKEREAKIQSNLNHRSSLPTKEAQIKYYENYKKLEKLSNRKNYFTESMTQPVPDEDPPIGLLQKTDSLGILPCCMGLVNSKGDSSVVNIKGQKFGDKYFTAVSQGLKQAKLIQKCIFSNNRLTDKGFSQLLKNISPEISKLDVSFNSISKIDEKLFMIVSDTEARLEHLNLEGNLISDSSIMPLLESGMYSKHLKYLNLRKNLITGKSAEAIVNILDRSQSLEELYIGMNRFHSDVGKILQALSSNRYLKVFDFCLNKLGSCTPSCAKAVANMIINNKVLVHVDLSENNFNEEESKIIAEGLEKNKRIYGFHFRGNYGYIDSKGFLQLEQRKLTTLHSLVTKNINSYDIIFPRENTNFEAVKYKNVCWICEGWYEQTFKFVVPQPSADNKNLVFIHFDFEQFEPRLINVTETNIKYKTMVPPKNYRYFFTWNKQQFTQSPSKDGKKNADQSTVRIEFPATYRYEMNHQIIELKPQIVAARTGKAKRIVDNWDELIVSVLPRQTGLVTKKQKIPWTYKDSLWYKEWKLDDDNLIKNCFEKDWKNSKLMNLIKNQGQQDKVKDILRKDYRLIKEIYKYYASWSPFNGDIWAVSSNAFTQFCSEGKITSKDTPLKILDLTFITTNSMSGGDWKGNSLVPERGLIRFQFMESIVRLAEEKFKKTGLVDSILGSVTNMLKDHIEPLQNNPIFNSQKWRLTKYFIEENDMLLKKYRPIFTEIYKKNSRMKVKPGNKSFMCLVQFKSIFERIGIAGTLVLERDIFISFNCSMMTQIDEIENQRYIRMSQIEFIEGVARCAYILPDSCALEKAFEDKVPFHGKFQWIIHQLKTLCSDDIKNQFPTTSLFYKNEDDD